MSEQDGHGARVCSVFHEAIELIGRRWTGAIISAMTQRPRRFSDFKEAIPELSDRLLTERLKELEEHGLVAREVMTGRPIQVFYRLTPKGEELQPIFEAIGGWARRWGELPGCPAATATDASDSAASALS